ncbi:unnamed protein product [Didymodactylos carnosus]|uniref:Uncharacterized protein n=1 Tax=Didymodactylos carnosus TaxID=1234261 RepID=A0A814D6D6_9BILA|nr:unnamed protein product [Didymodactylos carnosus]CAF0948991.1 unnamed protein product [Didymodactylos carnosus]CAF3518064.1 unnamed protein product [Didymodactylos carnosus]CAF3724851.1 unnamed protein product [Didymodactylos carnosus]
MSSVFVYVIFLFIALPTLSVLIACIVECTRRYSLRRKQKYLLSYSLKSKIFESEQSLPLADDEQKSYNQVISLSTSNIPKRNVKIKKISKKKLFKQKTDEQVSSISKNCLSITLNPQNDIYHQTSRVQHNLNDDENSNDEDSRCSNDLCNENISDNLRTHLPCQWNIRHFDYKENEHRKFENHNSWTYNSNIKSEEPPPPSYEIATTDNF